MRAPDRLGQRIEQHVEADMLAAQHAGCGGEKGNPDQQVAWHFLRPRHRLAEAITSDDSDDDDCEERDGQDDAHKAYDRRQQRDEPIEKFQHSHSIPRKGYRVADSTAALDLWFLQN